MALSWTDARTKVRGDLWKSATALPDDVVNRALHAALLAIESERRWLYLENISESATLVAATDTIVAPDNCKSIDTLAYVEDGNQEILTREQLSIVKRLASNSSGSWPNYYAFHGGNIHFDCVVPIGRQFYMVYKAATPEIMDAAIVFATNPTLDLHQQAVIAHACFQLAGTRLRNRDLARTYFETYEVHLSRMTDADDEARADLTGPSIAPYTEYYDSAFGNMGG